MKNNIKEIEELREAVIKKHFWKRYVWDMGYGDYKLEDRLNAAIDRKVLYYIQLGVDGKDLLKIVNKKREERKNRSMCCGRKICFEHGGGKKCLRCGNPCISVAEASVELDIAIKEGGCGKQLN